MSWYSRQNRHNRRYLLPKCCQICNQRATGLIVWDQPSISSALHSVPTFGNSTRRETFATKVLRG